MAVPNYPTFTPPQKPEQEGFHREPAYDPVLRPQFESGSEPWRSRVTKVPWRWSFEYRSLSTSNRNTLMTFWSDTVCNGAAVFRWTDPTDNVAYYVRFAAQPADDLEPDGSGTWRVRVQLQQALGTWE
jgi:hypothetical protein